MSKQLAVVCAASFLSLAGVACDDDDDDDVKPDAAKVDAMPVDAVPIDAVPIDAGPDAMPKPKPTHGGTISVTELALRAAPTVRGAAVGIDFGSVAPNTVTETFGNPTAVAQGCSGFLLDVVKNEAAFTPSGDEGDVTVTGGLLPIPTCKYDGTAKRYLCKGLAGAGTDDADSLVGPVAVQGQNTFTIALKNSPFAEANDAIGRHIIVQSALTGQSNTLASPTWPIVGFEGTAKTVTYTNNTPGALGGSFKGSGFQVVAGAGPVPSGTAFLPEDPADKTKIAVTFAPKEGGNFTAFTAAAEVDPTGLFTLADATLDTIPLDLADSDTTTKHTVACAGGSCTDGLAAVIVLSTTDADVSSVGPFDMPPATKLVASIKCIGDEALTDKKVTVTNEALHFLKKSGATRYRATFLRFPFPTDAKSDGVNKVKIVAGHGIIGYGTKQ